MSSTPDPTDMPTRPTPCEHELWVGVDTTPMDDPAKLWQCALCGHRNGRALD